MFSEEEIKKLNELQEIFTKNISELSELEFKKELERLAIDLSWKSSQIEGKTMKGEEAIRAGTFASVQIYDSQRHNFSY